MEVILDHELLDFGGAARLERFGDRVVDRPHPGALGARHSDDGWRGADLRYDRAGGWSGPAVDDGPWTVTAGPLTLELRATDAGQVGLFPEHAAMLPWLAERIEARVAGGAAAAADDERPDVLHLFAATGLATLAMASAGAAVVHLDASRPTVAWARRNAELSDLAGAPIRWIVDDAMGFVEREARRGRHYVGIVLDPPSYGHAAGGRRWQLEDDLDGLLAACAAVLDRDGFMLLTAHTPNYGPDRLGAALAAATRRSKPRIESGELGLITADGRTLELGGFARTRGGA